MNNYETYVIARQRWLDNEKFYLIELERFNKLKELRINLHDKMCFGAACLNSDEREKAANDQFGLIKA